MRDRLKRRKKEPEKAGSETGPAPLQPAFYDTEPEKEPAAEPANAEPVNTESEPQPEVAAAPAVEGAPQAGNGAQRRRRRRGRGGRNRGGTRPTQAVPAESVPATPALDQPAAEPVQIPAAPPRPPKGTVVLAIGLPGSGKSAWFKRHNINPLSSDMLRALLFDDATEQRFQDLIFSNLRSMLKARLIARRPMNYVDATNLTPHERHSWIKLGKDYGYEVQAVFFDVPVETCLERNRKRDRVVPEDVMRRMAAKLKAPTFEEGFSKITVVRVKQKE